jgi:riboflavin kinase / FMN adenylyltransferase
MSPGRLKDMIVVGDAQLERLAPGASAVAIGVFDGLHLGHQRVIAELLDVARRDGVTSTVVTFDPHPAGLLDPEHAPRLLATLDQRLEGLAALGVDQVRVVTFDEALSLESASSFIDRVLVGELRASSVIVGEDFRFGHGRAGDPALLADRGAQLGFSVIAAPLYGDEERWSSTAVRRMLASGDLAGAATMLGRPFVLRGAVEHGDARGAELGFPTANVATAPDQQLPGVGIYAGAVRLAPGEWWPGAISVGTRPQFYERGELLVEVHLVDLRRDLYGATLDVAFLERLRDEATFVGVNELVAQISRDVTKTVGIFEKFSPDASVLLG